MSDTGTQAQPQPQSVERPGPAPRSSLTGLLVTIALALAVVGAGAAFLAVGEIARLRADVAAMKEAGDEQLRRAQGALTRLSSAVALLSAEEVDLSSPKLQNLRHGFAVSELRMARKENGIVVSGRIVNGTTLHYRGATFRLRAGGKAKEFEVDELPPGGAGSFEVELPTVPIDETRGSTLSFVTSNVQYGR